MLQHTWWCEHVVTAVGYEYIVTAEGSALSHATPGMNNRKSHDILLQTHINFPRFLPIFPDFLERLSHLAPIY
jgi:hypothetical protein